jgi:hypothetical protein
MDARWIFRPLQKMTANRDLVTEVSLFGLFRFGEHIPKTTYRLQVLSLGSIPPQLASYLADVDL